MIILDTDHCSVLFDGRTAKHGVLTSRLKESFQEIALPIVAIEEQLRGFLAYIHRERDVIKQVWPYSRMAAMLRAFSGLSILDFTQEAASLMLALKKKRVKVGAQDLKIASIALSTESLLLSANLRDYEQVPGLHVENWLT